MRNAPKASGLVVLLALCSSGCPNYAPPPRCQNDRECPAWHCACGSGIADAAKCSSARCAIAEDVCHDACKAVGSCWQGRATGGWVNGNSVGPTECVGGTGGGSGGDAGCGDQDFPDLGMNCTAQGDCQSRICLGTEGSYICTKRCESVAQCPAGWACAVNSLGFSSCMIGAPEDQGAELSTNTACKQVAFTDIGAACQFGSDCQSKICFGSVAGGYVCTRRCNDESLCVASWQCVTSSLSQARFCQP